MRQRAQKESGATNKQRDVLALTDLIDPCTCSACEVAGAVAFGWLDQIAAEGELIHHLAEAPLRVEVRMRIGRGVDDHRTAAERLHLEARALEDLQIVLERRVLRRRQTQRNRKQQTLTVLHASAEPTHQL